MAEETNHVSVEGLSAEDIKTARKVLLAMIENLARDELVQVVPARKTGVRKVR